MANDADFSVEATPSLQQLIEFFVATLTSPGSLARFADALAKGVQIGATVAGGAQIEALKSLPEKKAEIVKEIEDYATLGFTFLMSKLVGHMLGVEVTTAQIQAGADRPEESTIGRAIANVVRHGIEGEGGELEPSDDGSMRLVSMLAHMTVQSWFEGIILEELESLHGWLKAPEAVAELGHQLVDSMGLNRLARTAMRPLVRTVATTPLQWKVNKLYRPNQLSEGEILKAFQRGDYTGDEASEELARLGYSPRRQDLLIKSAAKRLSVDDVQVLRRARVLERDYALQNLRDEGYDDVTANYLVTAAEERRYAGIRDDSLSTIMRAFSDREIDEGQLRTLMDGVVDDDIERDLHVNAAQRSRQFNVKHLSHGEVLECVELGVLAIPDYRRWLEREGYVPDDADALELRLRVKLEKGAKAADERQRLAAEKAKAQADAAAARQKRLDELEAQRALHARGSIADLRRAVARGLIPLDRLAEVLRAEYDADTVQMLLELAEQDRADYVAQQQRADDARKRAAQRNIDLGTLEQGVLHHVITVDAYRDAVAERGFAPADVQILTATLAAKLQDQDAATAKRAQAEQAAKVKHIDLGRFERLVRRGIRPLDQYRALLDSLGYDDASIAAMVDLLNADIADDTAARQLRDAARQKSTGADLTLEQMRRAVLLGLKTDQDFQGYLVKLGYTSEAQAVLVAELRRDVADAESARLQRQTLEGAAVAVDLPLSRITAAARLGIITPDAYAQRLEALGYTDDDIAIEMELLLQEIAQVQATRAKQTATDTLAAGRGLSLADIARAVKAGAASLADYRARAIALGYTTDDAELLVSTLQAELDALDDARKRRVTIDGELAARTLSLGQLEDAVKAGAITLDAYQQQLEAWGYGADDAELLAALLADTLAKKAAG
jgi:hypothetical protein